MRVVGFMMPCLNTGSGFHMLMTPLSRPPISSPCGMLALKGVVHLRRLKLQQVRWYIRVCMGVPQRRHDGRNVAHG